jgi:hypothetical protein
MKENTCNIETQPNLVTDKIYAEYSTGQRERIKREG